MLEWIKAATRRIPARHRRLAGVLALSTVIGLAVATSSFLSWAYVPPGTIGWVPDFQIHAMAHFRALDECARPRRQDDVACQGTEWEIGLRARDRDIESCNRLRDIYDGDPEPAADTICVLPEGGPLRGGPLWSDLSIGLLAMTATYVAIVLFLGSLKILASSAPSRRME